MTFRVYRLAWHLAAALLVFVSQLSGQQVLAGECASQIIYKTFIPSCQQDGARLLIIPTPILIPHYYGAASTTIAQLNAPSVLPFAGYDIPGSEAPDWFKPSDQNPVSELGLKIAIEADPHCETCDHPWQFGDNPTITVDATSPTLENLRRHGLELDQIVAGAFYATILTFEEDKDATYTLQYRATPPDSGWQKQIHWKGKSQSLAEGPLNGWKLVRQFNGSWSCLRDREETSDAEE